MRLETQTLRVIQCFRIIIVIAMFVFVLYLCDNELFLYFSLDNFLFWLRFLLFSLKISDFYCYTVVCVWKKIKKVIVTGKKPTQLVKESMLMAKNIRVLYKVLFHIFITFWKKMIFGVINSPNTRQTAFDPSDSDFSYVDKFNWLVKLRYSYSCAAIAQFILELFSF